MDRALRQQVFERAKGSCEYCRLPASSIEAEFCIDHIVAIQHGGQAVLSNLALACPFCNRHKGPNVGGIDGGVFVRSWGDHFIWNGCLIAATSTIGRVTVQVLQMNHPLPATIRGLLIAEGMLLPDEDA